MKIPNKELKGLFKGKLGKAFEKLKNLVQKGISWLKKNHLWDKITKLAKNLGKNAANELCQSVLPDSICGSAVDFALDNGLGSDDYDQNTPIDYEPNQPINYEPNQPIDYEEEEEQEVEQN